MPRIYLSPSTQEKNQYINGGTEEYYMNKIADAMEPYLRSNGIRFTRNTPEMTAVSSIRESNAGNYDLHLALHSNAAPESLSGRIQGTDVYYYPSSRNGKRAAEIIAKNLKNIYPLPDKVRTLSTTYLGEVRQPKAPSAFIEFAYHDNAADANWIKNNIDAIARNVVYSLTQYFGIPFVNKQEPRSGTVTTTSGGLNIRSKPNAGATVLATAPDGATLTVLGSLPGWYVVNYNGTVGYAAANYITV